MMVQRAFFLCPFAWLVAVSAVYAQTGTYADVHGRLSDGRDLVWQLRDAASEAVLMDRYNDEESTQKHIAEATRLARRVEDALARGRRSLDEGVRRGDIGPELADLFRQKFDQYEQDLLGAVNRLEENLEFEWPEVSDPVEPPPAPPEDDEIYLPTPQEDFSSIEEELREFRDEVRSAWEHGQRTYGYRYASATLDEAFSEAGVEWARRYADSWGDWVFVDISGTHSRHSGWLHVLDAVVSRLEEGRTVDPRYLRYLRAARDRWNSESEQVNALSEDMIRIIAQRGKHMDVKHENWTRHMQTYTTDSETADVYAENSKAAAERADQAREEAAELARRIKDPAWLVAPQSYDEWAKENVFAEPEPIEPVAPTESERFRDEVRAALAQMDRRLADVDSLIWDFDRVQQVAESFDSDYFRTVWDFYEFEGRTMIGGEVNYYFQGMFWRRMGVPKQVMYRVFDAWNVKSGRRIGNTNQYYAARAGWRDMDDGMEHPDGAAAYFESPEFTGPDIQHVGENPNHEIPGYENRWIFP